MKLYQLFIAISTIATSVMAQVPTSGLALYLPFSGTSVDSSGTGKQITAQGITFGTGPNSILTQAAYFNGTSSRIDFAPVTGTRDWGRGEC
jgi:hypothetical protein